MITRKNQQLLLRSVHLSTLLLFSKLRLFVWINQIYFVEIENRLDGTMNHSIILNHPDIWPLAFFNWQLIIAYENEPPCLYLYLSKWNTLSELFNEFFKFVQRNFNNLQLYSEKMEKNFLFIHNIKLYEKGDSPTKCIKWVSYKWCFIKIIVRYFHENHIVSCISGIILRMYYNYENYSYHSLSCSIFSLPVSMGSFLIWMINIYF